MIYIHDLDDVNFQDFLGFVSYKLQCFAHLPTAASYKLRLQLQELLEIPKYDCSWVITWV
jgi:hypothetical protein